MNIIYPSSIDDSVTVTDKGLFSGEKRIYLKMMKTSIVFSGDNKRFEPDSSKVKKYIRFRLSDEEYEALHSLSLKNGSKNCWVDEANQVATAYVNDFTKFFDKDNKPLSDVDMSDLRDAVVDVIVGGCVFKNKYGTFERLTVRQLRIVEKKERQSMFDVSLF